MEINTHVQFIFALLAGLMITFSIWHTRSLYLAFAAIRDDQTEQPKRADMFFSRQYRRRLQMWILIGCAGFFILCGLYISPKENLTLFVVVWILAMLSLVWTILIAMIDAISINLFYSTARHEEAANQAKKRHSLEKKVEQQLELLKSRHPKSDPQDETDENISDG